MAKRSKVAGATDDSDTSQVFFDSDDLQQVVDEWVQSQLTARAEEVRMAVEPVIGRTPPPDGESQLLTTSSSSLIRLTNVRADGRFAGIDGSGYSVVIIDSGADLDHSAFGADADGNGVADRIRFQYDFSGSNDGNANATDQHGTHVAGTVGSQNSAYLGMAPAVNLIILKVFPDNSGSASSTDVEEAARWVVNNASAYNIVAVNMSLGFGNFNAPESTYLHDEFQSMVNLGIAPVVATGNSFFSNGSAPGVGNPSVDSLAWGVGAVYDSNIGGRSYGSGAIDNTTAADRITSFTQRTTTPGLVDIFAPGADITNAVLNNGSGSLSGTSMAAPHIAGIVALAQEYAVQLSGNRLPVNTLLDLMRNSAVTIVDGDDENDNVTNTGGSFKRVDVYALMEAIQAHFGGGGAGSVTINDVSITEGNSGTQLMTFTVTRTGGSAAFNVNYATANGTATAGSDYAAANGTLSFGSGVNSRIVQITINGDTTAEATENFVVNLSGATNGATIADGQGVGTITNDDGGGGGGDDFADSLTDSTAPMGSVSVNGTATGNLETLADRDWFRITLTQNQTYQFDLAGVDGGGGTLADPYIRIYNAAGTMVASNDDIAYPDNVDSRVSYQANANGFFYVEAGSYNDAHTGTYRVSVSGQPSGPDAARFDFNGDAIGDLLWRNNDGRLTTWQMNGATAQQNVLSTFVTPDWKVQGTGDFNGDRRADLLWRNDNGQFTTWQMDGGTPTQNVISSYVSTDWRVDGIGDFNGDRRDDILWRHNNGTYSTWQLDGANVTYNVQVVATDPNWRIVGIGDFNADGRDDLLWRHLGGQLATWQMNGATWQQDVIYTAVGTDWHVLGVGDFNGDNRDDIVWRNNNGQVTTWQLDGATVNPNVFMSSAPTDWQIIDVSDFNGDGKDDLLWRNVNSGQISTWQMNAATATHNVFTPFVGTDWRTQPDPYDFV